MAERDFPDEWLSTTAEGLVGAERLEEIRSGDVPGNSLWEVIVGSGAATDDEILIAISTRFRMNIVESDREPDRQARELVPELVARQYGILPLRVSDSTLEIATPNPFDIDCEKTLAFATGREVRMSLASPSFVAKKLDELYRPENVIDQLLEGMNQTDIQQLDAEQDAEELNVSAEEASQRPVVRLVDVILSEGILSRASDIHMEPEEGGVAVRYRIDGVLREVMKIPRGAGLPLISRFKIIANLDIADRLRPQDGRARVAINGAAVDLRISTLPASLGEKVVVRILDARVDLRISTLPASLGEKVVVRILDARGTVLSLDGLGLGAGEADQIKALLDYRDGIILVTGPTGSGKTTTLYSAIRHVQSEGLNIVTVEDPVEYRLTGIVQVQVHEKAGLTFASALRSILRQDPDVVLVGEIRDRETAQVAIQASLTGHLVFSTLHTNDAANAVTRLIDIGMEPFKIASALRGVVAQRLMRRLCETCSQPMGEAIPEKFKRWIPAETELHRGVGCPECAMTGYRGRFSIVEVLRVSEDIEALIGAGATADRVAATAREEGMKNLWDSGLAHVIAGNTTIDELLRVVDMPSERSRKSGVNQVVQVPPMVNGEVPLAPNSNLTGDGGAGAAIIQQPLPYARGSSPALDFELLEGHGAGDNAVSVTPDTSKGTVLLVDDEDQLRHVMSDLLGREGYQVIEARDGSEALDQVDRHAPDVIVLDLNLPGMDGYSVLAELRSRPATKDIPIVVLTARGDEDNEVRVFELGADDFMSKPFRAKALSARLQAVLGRRRAR